MGVTGRADGGHPHHKHFQRPRSLDRAVDEKSGVRSAHGAAYADPSVRRDRVEPAARPIPRVCGGPSPRSAPCFAPTIRFMAILTSLEDLEAGAWGLGP